MSPRGEELAVAILQHCLAGARKTLDKGEFLEQEEIFSEFGKKNQKDIISVIKNYLLPKGYLKKLDDIPSYRITQLGKSYLSKQHVSNYLSIGDNVNFAYNSPGVMQYINITELEDDIQQLVDEFDEAIKTKDKDKLKQVYGYIVHKSGGGARSYTIGALMR